LEGIPLPWELDKDNAILMIENEKSGGNLMPNPNAEINPRLISAVTGQDLTTIKDMPTYDILPGKYAKKVAARKKLILPMYGPNKHNLICGHCGRKSKYDLGLVMINSQRWLEHDRQSQKSKKQTGEDFMEYIQSTAYFRCKHCNGAGNWKDESPMLVLRIMARLMMGGKSDGSKYATGEFKLFDGSAPRWMSDGEERFLDKLQGEKGHDAYLWNRLGNLYYKGSRSELAVVAFEQSLRLDLAQIESHFSLGNILVGIDEDESAAYHFRMMLVYARLYQKMEPLQMRDMLTAGLQFLFEIHERSKGSIPFIPSCEELAVVDGLEELQKENIPENLLSFIDLEIFPDCPESFWPIAEMYMGNRRIELPAHDRTLDKYLPGNGMTETGKKEDVDTKKQGSIFSQGKENTVLSLGSRQCPIVVKVNSEEKGQKIAQICDRLGLHYIMGFELKEDLSDLKQVIKEKFAPASPYNLCPCGSGTKYKFCCAKKVKNLDIDRFIAD